MNKIETAPIDFRVTNDHFGGCPQCHGDDGYFNVRSNHFFKCNRHLTVWSVGSNLFSSWLDEDEGDWNQNIAQHRNYTEVEPYRKPRAEVDMSQLEDKAEFLLKAARVFSIECRALRDPKDVHNALQSCTELVIYCGDSGTYQLSLHAASDEPRPNALGRWSLQPWVPVGNSNDCVPF